MPKRMSEKDRVRGSNRVRILIADIRYHGKLFCPYCQQKITDSPHIDHIVARRNGGKVKEFDNLITCCASCNGRKCDTNVLQIFGKAIDEAVNAQIKNRVLTETDKQAAVDIFHSDANWQERLEMILDWVESGFLPIR
jgi:hypothetical protein